MLFLKGRSRASSYSADLQSAEHVADVGQAPFQRGEVSARLLSLKRGLRSLLKALTSQVDGK